MAVVKGRSRGNGSQLANYLLQNKENDSVQVLDIRGTSHPQDLKKSLLEMSLSSELTKGKHGLYHLQFNPAIGEDQTMTPEDWLTAADILDKHLELDGHKRAIVLHEKNGRIHAHISWERYDYETGKLWDDGLNYRKHDQAREEIERVLGHERTRQQEKEQDPQELKKSDYKRELSDFWEQATDGESFAKEAEKAGYQIAIGDDRRPWRIITPEGESLDLVRQLETAKTKDVRERLQPIRDQLQTEAEALEEMREAAKQKENEKQRETAQQPDKKRELSESQDLAAQMIFKVREAKQAEPEPKKSYGYSFNFTQPPAPKNEPEKQPDKDRVSDSQDKAVELLEQYRQKQAERERQQEERARKQREAQEAAKEQTEKLEQDDRAAELLRQYRERQEERQRNRDRGLYFEL